MEDNDINIEKIEDYSNESADFQDDVIISENQNASEVKWTKEQGDAIDDRGKNLLVSASAGSGKTAVMTQRIIDLVTKEKVPISSFLIVTFTSASAQDMKAKIIKKFQELPADPFILEQIDLIPTSDISDLHSFYSRLVSTYFYEIEIDPSYHIIDDIESSYLKDKAISRLFEQKEKSGDVTYLELFEIFQKKRQDDALKDAIWQFSNLLDSQIDGEKWFNEKLEETYNEDLKENICIKTIIDYVAVTADSLSKTLDNFADELYRAGLEKYYYYFIELASKFRAFSKDKSYVVNGTIASNFVLERRPSLTKEQKLDENLVLLSKKSKLFYDNAKNTMQEFQSLLKFTNEGFVKKCLNQSKTILKSLYSLTKEYSKLYSDLKHEANGLDFNDLEKYAYKILSNPSICSTVKSKYKYIFVDEYQDINTIQEKIISMISSETNRFMVGDLKQSIYRFRLCDPEIFLEKYRDYSGNGKTCKVVKLNKNFRSDKKILKFVDRIFSGVMTENFGGIDYEKESQFSAGDKNLDLPHSTTLAFIDTTTDDEIETAKNEVYSVKNHIETEDEGTKVIIAEAKYVAQKIAEIIKEHGVSGNKISFSDFAVLVSARNIQISNFIDTLKALNIPVSSDEKVNLMERPNIQEILNFVKYVDNFRDDFLLFKVLKSRFFDFSDRELVEIRNVSKKIRFYDTIKFYDLIQNENLKNKILHFFDVIKKYSRLSKIMQIKDFVKLLVKDFKIERLNLIEDDGESENEILAKFISSLPSCSVTEFLINYSKFSVKIQNECGGNAVKVMTIHRSKGLEFKYVFIINMSRRLKFDSIRGRILFNKNFGVGLKSFDIENRIELSNPAMEAIKIYEKQKIAEEQQRVLYVALTRAVEKLFVICSTKKEKLTLDFPSIPIEYNDWFKPLILKCENGEKFEEFDYESYNLSDFSDEKVVESKQLAFYDENVDRPSEFSYYYKDSIDIPLKNSVTKILNSNGFEESLKYLEKNNNEEKTNIQNSLELEPIDAIDDIDDDYEIQEINLNDELNYFATRGTAYHKVFQNIDFENLKDIDSQLKNIFESDSNLKEFVDEKKVKGVLALPFFHSLQNFKILKEREFFASVPAGLLKEDAVNGDKIIMQGVIDFLAVSEDEIFVLDYKTGKNTPEKLEKYKFQLDIYCDICERIFNKKVTKKIICFIDEQNIIEL